MKILAESEKTVIVIPVIVKPIQVQLTLIDVLVQNTNVAVTVRIKPSRTRALPSIPPPIEYSLGCIVFGDVVSLAQRAKFLHDYNHDQHFSSLPIADCSLACHDPGFQPSTTVAMNRPVYSPLQSLPQIQNREKNLFPRFAVKFFQVPRHQVPKFQIKYKVTKDPMATTCGKRENGHCQTSQ
ncbi:MAG: hypothetical protein V1707_00140 [bacterium]